ncbi:hypothetical protein COT78_01300 [Candidatus Berkelbacteria bacterium CG10_big_fil_rev_8_21_14_0_10_43_13]|uniref:Fido domain-containing protein n=1 Tax=Candidatus Berkelbacteria bacterium CG10_big_fil_rev_8_21_14_0_10_43_13 TaxID=1974514 RepID=A0A2H0W6W8_9BACT|nr:MAG: hypothetical protein COT78_01300 [Candidatus Berkelbacteria bacterium CG10_big_fil_rev_8_21_14_0_10_43_13]
MREPRFESDSPESRQEGHNKFDRFAHLYGVVADKDSVVADSDDEKPREIPEGSETRLKILKDMEAGKFLDILSVSNGLLRGAGFTRWSGEAADTTVAFGGGSMKELEPPENAEILFEHFFKELQQKISAETTEIWAVKLYVALVFAHMFPDGNGRLARNAYSFIKDGHILEEGISSERGTKITEFCQLVNYYSVMRLLQKNGIYEGDDVNGVLDYQADEQYDVGAELPRTLKYIAASRIGLVKNGEKRIFGDDWTEEETERFRAEYQKVKVEWYQESQIMIDHYDEWAIEKLGEALGKKSDTESE